MCIFIKLLAELPVVAGFKYKNLYLASSFLFILAINNPFSLFSDMVLLIKFFKRLSAENVLSGVKEETSNVANNCKSILMLGRRLVR
jgi:hypothetical protein